MPDLSPVAKPSLFYVRCTYILKIKVESQNNMCTMDACVWCNFYNKMWQTWAEIHDANTQNIVEICSQRICNNLLIMTDNMPIFNRTWNDKHMTHIKDVITNHSTLIRENDIEMTYNISTYHGWKPNWELAGNRVLPLKLDILYKNLTSYTTLL